KDPEQKKRRPEPKTVTQPPICSNHARTRLLVSVNRRHVRHCHKLLDRRGLYKIGDSKISRLVKTLIPTNGAGPDDSLPRGSVQYPCASGNPTSCDAAGPS